MAAASRILELLVVARAFTARDSCRGLNKCHNYFEVYLR